MQTRITYGNSQTRKENTKTEKSKSNKKVMDNVRFKNKGTETERSYPVDGN